MFMREQELPKKDMVMQCRKNMRALCHFDWVTAAGCGETAD